MTDGSKLSELKSRKDSHLPRKSYRKAIAKKSRQSVKKEMRQRRIDLTEMDEMTYAEWWAAYRVFIR